MKYNYHVEVDYEYEARILIEQHYDEKNNFLSQYQHFLNKKIMNNDKLKEMFDPLFEIEKDVFDHFQVDQKDYDFYFRRCELNSEDTLYEFNLCDIICRLNYLNIDNEIDEKKMFVSLLSNDVEFDSQIEMSEKDFFDYLKDKNINAQMKWNVYEVFTNLMEHKLYIQNLLESIIVILKKHDKTLKKIIAENPYKDQLYLLQKKHSLSHYDNEKYTISFCVLGFNQISICEFNYQEQKYSFIYYGAYVDILIIEENKQSNISERLANHLKRLADNSRLKILFLLREKSMCGQEIKEELHLSNATISHHMGELIGASFVLARKEGNKTYYSLNRVVIKDMLDEMQALLVDTK